MEKLFVADKFLDQGAWGDQLGTDGEEVAVAFQQALHRLTVLAGVLDLLQQTGNDSGVQKRLVVVAGIDEDIGGAAAGLHVQQLAAQHILPHLHGAQRWGAAVQVIPDDAAGQAKVAGIQQGVAKPGKNAPWLLIDATQDADAVARATAYVNAKPAPVAAFDTAPTLNAAQIALLAQLGAKAV